jgi:hypothetical protein
MATRRLRHAAIAYADTSMQRSEKRRPEWAAFLLPMIPD